MSGLRELYLCVLCRTEFSFEFDCSLGIGEFRMHLNVFFFFIFWKTWLRYQCRLYAVCERWLKPFWSHLLVRRLVVHFCFLLSKKWPYVDETASTKLLAQPRYTDTCYLVFKSSVLEEPLFNQLKWNSRLLGSFVPHGIPCYLSDNFIKHTLGTTAQLWLRGQWLWLGEVNPSRCSLATCWKKLL